MSKCVLFLVYSNLHLIYSPIADPKGLKKKKKTSTKDLPTPVEVKLDQATYDWILREAPEKEAQLATKKVGFLQITNEEIFINTN